jgi:hypothetical protein
MTELEDTVVLANKILDRISADPDDDLAMLSRQFLRTCAENERLRGLLEKVDVSVEKLKHCKALCARAADALEGYGTKPWHQYRELIEDLRKAAQ